MADDMIPDEVKQFILENIDSVAHLEGLLLFRSSPQAEWGVEEVAKRLYIGEEQAATILARLHDLGLLAVKEEKPSSYRYAPDTPDLGQMVEIVASTYAKYLVPVTNLIHSKPQTRVQEFADAFKLTRKKK